MSAIIDELMNLNNGYSIILGHKKGVSSTSGKPYEIFSVVTKVNDNNTTVENIFNNNVGQFPISIGEKVMFLYAGNGNYKNIVQVVKQK